MRLMYPALTLVSLLLVSMPAMASPMAIAISIDWARVAISGGLAVCFIALYIFAAWVAIEWPTERVLFFMAVITGLASLAIVVHLCLSL